MPTKSQAAKAKGTSKSASKVKPEVIELSSDSSSDYDDLCDVEAEDVKAESSAETPLRNSKRKSVDEDDKPSASETKKQKLAVRVKDSGFKESHRHIDLEIPVSRLGVTASDGAPPAAVQPLLEETTQEAEAEPEVAVTPAPKQSKHIIFGDDDHDQDHTAEFFTPPEASNSLKIQEAEEQGEEEDSDDDAPEAVSTQHAAAQAEKAAQAVAKAAEKQSEVQKRKRQERDARFKVQAEARKAVDERKKEKAAADASPEPEQRTTKHGRKRGLDKRSLPSVLPAEFLESDSEDDADVTDDGERERERRANKKVKFTTLEKQVAHQETRRPQDQVVGSTVYRVVRQVGNDRMAPKINKSTRNLKEDLLARKRVGHTQRKGFFVK